MDGITATELQLLACFGVEPQLLEPTDPWCYNDAAYMVEVDGYSVSFAIAPSYPDVRIIVKLGERRVFEFNSMGVRDVRVIDEFGVDAVEVVLAEVADPPRFRGHAGVRGRGTLRADLRLGAPSKRPNQALHLTRPRGLFPVAPRFLLLAAGVAAGPVSLVVRPQNGLFGQYRRGG